MTKVLPDAFAAGIATAAIKTISMIILLPVIVVPFQISCAALFELLEYAIEPALSIAPCLLRRQRAICFYIQKAAQDPEVTDFLERATDSNHG